MHPKHSVGCHLAGKTHPHQLRDLTACWQWGPPNKGRERENLQALVPRWAWVDGDGKIVRLSLAIGGKSHLRGRVWGRGWFGLYQVHQLPKLTALVKLNTIYFNKWPPTWVSIQHNASLFLHHKRAVGKSRDPGCSAGLSESGWQSRLEKLGKATCDFTTARKWHPFPPVFHWQVLTWLGRPVPAWQLARQPTRHESPEGETWTFGYFMVLDLLFYSMFTF